MSARDPDSLSDLGTALQQSIRHIAAYDARMAAPDHSQKFHVPAMGHIVSSAYEQLRNASENAEDHLLLQRAARRFFVRNVTFHDKTLSPQLAQELIIELTQAEYLPNDSVSHDKITSLNRTIASLHDAYWQVLATHPKLPRETVQSWTLDLLSVKAEHAINYPIRPLTFAHFAHQYFARHLDVAAYVEVGEPAPTEQHPWILYTSIHRALLKSDDANIRTLLLDLHHISTDNIDQYVEFHRRCDEVLALKTTRNVTRAITKNGAPMRIIKLTFFDEHQTMPAEQLAKRANTLSVVEQRIDDEYRLTRGRLNRGIMKSIVFLLITKALIGLLIEVPYDIAVYQHIIWLPLIINLLFPSLFIAASTLTLKMPGTANTKALVGAIDDILYHSDSQPVTIRPKKAAGSATFNVVYAIMFALAIGIITYLLILLQFNIVQGAIFMIFLSTAAFLGYRLSLQIKELEMVAAGQSLISILRDFLYTPFILIGHQISYRYAKINIMSRILDTIIELPLKTTLRLVRQWTAFLSVKKDELL